MLCCFVSSSGVETIGNNKPKRRQTLTMTAVVMTKSMLKQGRNKPENICKVMIMTMMI